MTQDRHGDGTPLYRSVAAALAAEIESQGWPAHTKLPSELSLAAQYGVSRGTVTKALDSLVLRGLIYRKRPNGTFVAPPPHSSAGRAPGESTPAQRQADVIGVIVGGIIFELMDSVHGSIIMGIQTVARAAGYDIVLALSENDVTMERYYVEEMCARGVGGLILFVGSHPVEQRNGALVSVNDEIRVAALKAMQEQDKPFVLVDRWVPAVHSDWVVSDDKAAGRTATDHLIALGHRRVGFMTTTPYITSIANRFSGYSSSLKRHGIEVDHRLVHRVREGPWEPHSRQYWEDSGPLQAYLRGPERPSAVVTSNDYVALQLVFAAEDAGLRVPDDLAVVSCGWGGKMGAYGRVPLTSVIQPLIEIGRQATHVLLDRMAGRSSITRQITLPVSLAVRESCGASARTSALAAQPPA
jgi:DNA-binding LacI/PurR family transcriptional regulator